MYGGRFVSRRRWIDGSVREKKHNQVHLLRHRCNDFDVVAVSMHRNEAIASSFMMTQYPEFVVKLKAIFSAVWNRDRVCAQQTSYAQNIVCDEWMAHAHTFTQIVNSLCIFGKNLHCEKKKSSTLLPYQRGIFRRSRIMQSTMWSNHNFFYLPSFVWMCPTLQSLHVVVLPYTI